MFDHSDKAVRPRRRWPAISRRSYIYRAGLLFAAVSLSIVTLSPDGSAAVRSSRAGAPISGGTATYALSVGDVFSWILPYPNQANYEPWDQDVEYDMWRPLYFPGQGNKPVINYKLSLAYPPVYSDHNRTVTIRLKHFMWSDGKLLTTRDVQFGINLFSANKSQIAVYLPGEFPSNVTGISYVSPTEFVMHLNRSYSQQWYTNNQLVNIVPLPQQAWDRVSPGGAIGNYDRSTSGAKKVFSFLYHQAEDLSTYATNPLWKVVDGPWTLTSYNATTSRTVLSRNGRYSGPEKPHLAHVVIETFSSDTAEVDALRSGTVTYGYIPFSDHGMIGYLKANGYTVAPWAPDYVQWAELGYTSPTYGPLVRQLYIRQALQHFIDAPLYLKTAMNGFGQIAYGPVPNIPGSPYVSPQEKIDPYPYAPGSAKSLLVNHGWGTGSNGYMVCRRPGTAKNDCGAGIAKGRKLDLLMMYQSGFPSLAAQVEAFQTAARAGGIDISLDPQTETTMYSIAGVCPPGPCNWGIAIYANWLWDYGDNPILPTEGQQFGLGNYWGGGYYSATAQHLIDAAHANSGLKYVYAVENFLSRQVAALWFPTGDNRVSVIKDTLKGWSPQSAFGNPRPSRWYFVSS